MDLLNMELKYSLAKNGMPRLADYDMIIPTLWSNVANESKWVVIYYPCLSMTSNI